MLEQGSSGEVTTKLSPLASHTKIWLQCFQAKGVACVKKGFPRWLSMLEEEIECRRHCSVMTHGRLIGPEVREVSWADEESIWKGEHFFCMRKECRLHGSGLSPWEESKVSNVGSSNTNCPTNRANH